MYAIPKIKIISFYFYFFLLYLSFYYLKKTKNFILVERLLDLACKQNHVKNTTIIVHYKVCYNSI